MNRVQAFQYFGRDGHTRGKLKTKFLNKKMKNKITSGPESGGRLITYALRLWFELSREAKFESVLFLKLSILKNIKF